MDYQLVETDGSSLTKRVIEEYPEQHILALSNYDDIEYATKMLQAGARGYVMKNVGTDELIKAIHTVLEGKLYYAQHLANELIERKILGRGNFEAHLDNPIINRLSKREIEIIQLICDQLTNDEISKKLFLSKRTIDNHRQNILNKLGMNNTAGLVRFAVENGLVK
jgi:DNA-binding NarL/FixJ family response regulator